MSEPTSSSGDVARQALLQIQGREARSAAARSAPAEPVAIIGFGLRLPGGVDSAAAFADLLWSGRDAVTETPPERWPLSEPDDAASDAASPRAIRHGAFLKALDQFDAEFFGIAPREAESLDPQQRLLLEVGWEALENANQPPRELAGSQTGVYVGMGASDYGRELLSDPLALEAYAGSGAANGAAVGRLSYVLDLRGPSMAIDTASSSSLVAVHQAVQSLRLGECDMALAGGVNVILSPEPSLVLAKARMLAADGRCRSFAADAGGYVRGEGCAIVVLRRLAEAQARGERILGVIRGSATNQDGRSPGLTAPSGLAQEAVIAAALRAGGVDPLDISYVEAHGSGTPLGDPVEVGALGNALCLGRPADQPLTIGSVKSNIGHLESASGVVGLIKVLLAFERGEIPPNLHFTAGNPNIDWASLPIRVPTRPQAWEPVRGRRLAGVSSFGFGGSNAHVVLEAPPARVLAAATKDRQAHALVLSAQSDEALRALAGGYLARIDARASLADVCHAAAIGRTHFRRRTALVGADWEEVRGGLAALLAGGPIPAAVPRTPPSVQFRLAGPRASDAAAIATLHRTSPTFAAAFDDIAARLRDRAVPASRHLALQHGLAALWRAWGLAPVRVVAEAGGELAAAAVSGLIPIEQAIGVVDQGSGQTPAPLPAADDGALTIPLGGEAQGDPWRALVAEVARLYCAGAAIDWAGFDQDYARAPAVLPTYPFQRRRHWAPQVRAFATSSQNETSSPARVAISHRLTQAPAFERRRLVVDELRSILASACAIADAQTMAANVSLAKVGVDVMSVELHRQIEGRFGCSFTPTLLLNYQTIEELTDHILSVMQLTVTQQGVAHPPALAREELSDEAVQSQLRARLAELNS